MVMTEQIIINASNIGNRLNGIGVYSLSLLRELSLLERNINFEILLNESSEHHIRDIKFPENFKIRWVGHCFSPDHGFKGHLPRLLYSNLLFRKYKGLVFNTSQLEPTFFRSNQIITVHDAIPLFFKQHHKKQYYYYQHILKYALNAARAIITPSNHTKEIIQSIYRLSPDKIHVIHYGIQSTYFKEIKNFNADKEKFILYCGRIEASKNIMGILKAFELICDKIDHKLILVGSGEAGTIKTIHKDILSKTKTDSGRILFKGYIPSSEVLELYKKASLFIFPSFYEGFGFPPLEAMACGCPVVASKETSLPEVCGDAAYYVDPYDINSIAEGMHVVLTDEKIRSRLIEKGLERAKLFTWEKSAKEHLKLFRNIA